MTEAIFQGKWHQIKGAVKERWAKLTEGEIAAMEGKAEQLAGKLQEKYGYTKEQAEREVADFMKRFEDDDESSK